MNTHVSVACVCEHELKKTYTYSDVRRSTVVKSQTQATD